MKRLAIIISSVILVLAAGVLTYTILRQLDTNVAVPSRDQASSTPALHATEVITGLDHPWDVDFLPDETMIFTERTGDVSLLRAGKKDVLESISDVDATGEGGLMGLAIDPEFSTNRSMYVCLNSTKGDIRVRRLEINEDLNEIASSTDIVTGLPAASSGRHSGCQLAFGPDKNLWVGTGDSADESVAQDARSLGGKILRVDRDGKAIEGNPDSADKRVYSYGHRNIQALAFYTNLQNESYGISVEHGTDRDDEINELKPGNFGWQAGDNYDESASMTDLKRFPDAVPSIWSSGSPTIAPSGAAFLMGESWGRLKGWLAVSVLKDQKLLLLNIKNGSVSGERTYFKNEYGRLRAATLGPNETLYITTDNGNDAILKVAAN